MGKFHGRHQHPPHVRALGGLRGGRGGRQHRRDGQAGNHGHGGGRPDTDRVKGHDRGHQRHDEGGQRRFGLRLHLPVGAGERRHGDDDSECDGGPPTRRLRRTWANTIKVQASFKDDEDNAEGPLTSDATAAVVEACDALWCATMTAGSSGTPVGFSDGTSAASFVAMGSLSSESVPLRRQNRHRSRFGLLRRSRRYGFIYAHVHSQHSGQLGLHARAG